MRQPTRRTWYYGLLEELLGTDNFLLEQSVAWEAAVAPGGNIVLATKILRVSRAFRSNARQHRVKHWIPMLALANYRSRSSGGDVSHAEFNKTQGGVDGSQEVSAAWKRQAAKSSPSRHPSLGSIVGPQQLAIAGLSGPKGNKENKKTQDKKGEGKGKSTSVRDFVPDPKGFQTFRRYREAWKRQVSSPSLRPGS